MYFVTSKRVINLDVLCESRRTGTRYRLTQKPVELEEVYWRNCPLARTTSLSSAPHPGQSQGQGEDVMARLPSRRDAHSSDCSTLWPRSVLPSSQAGGARGVGSQEPHIEKQLGEGPLRSRLSLHGSVFTLDVRRAGGRQAARLQTLLLQGTGAVPHAPSPPSLQCRTGSPH